MQRNLMLWLDDAPDLDRVANVARQIARYLHAAHGAGVPHGDIMLSTVLVGPHDEVVGVRRSDVPPSAYLAPEYLSSDADHDVLTEMWALGVVFYRLVTGVMPFQNEHDLPKRFAAIVRGRYVPVRVARPDCPESLAAVIEDLLQLDRAKRLPNAAALTQRLAGISVALAN